METRADTARTPDNPKFRGSGESILIVDDDESVLKTVALLLRMKGYDVLTATGGCEALTKIRGIAKIRVLLTDIMMPIMDGVTLIRKLAQMHARVKIIASTGLPNEALREELRSLGVHKLLIKPFTPAKLLGAVRDVIYEDDWGNAADGEDPAVGKPQRHPVRVMSLT